MAWPPRGGGLLGPLGAEAFLCPAWAPEDAGLTGGSGAPGAGVAGPVQGCVGGARAPPAPAQPADRREGQNRQPRAETAG